MTSPRNVLIVDDNQALAENVCEIIDELERHIVSCRIASSRRSALQLAADHDVDAAIVDVHLPDGDGFELIDELRTRSPFAQVVIITGDATIETAVSAVHGGAFGYVMKPFRGAELLDTMARALDQSLLLREREQLRLALERSEERHRKLVENVPAFVLALDNSGKILVWNRELERVTGFSRDEMIGRPGADLVGAGADAQKLPLKEGGHRLVRWHQTTVPDHDHPFDLYAMGIDVTDEQEMMRRTLRAERLAAVGTLAAGLAHEVRNPLNSASLQLQVLQRRIDKGQTEPESLTHVTGLVREEINRLDHLVTDFLDFARPRPLELRSTELNDLVRSLVELVRPEAESNGISIETKLSSAAGVVEVDGERMRQVLLNLFRNALQAMGTEGVLTVETSLAERGGNVLVEVSDTGPGFAEDAPIFDAFYTTKEGGTGLGLAIVHQIISAHGGQVHVSSSPGNTKFSVELPQAAEKG